jgi:hypothetical protein
MPDWEGNMVEKKDQMKIILSEVEIYSSMVASAEIRKLESKFIDDRLEELQPVFQVGKEKRPVWQEIPCEVDEVSAVLCSISPLVDPDTMCSLLSERGDVGRFKSSIGSTNIAKDKNLQDDATETSTDEDSNASLASNNLEDDCAYKVDLDEFMASATHARPRKNTTAEHLSKVWCIDLERAKLTLDITTQNCGRVDNQDLSRNYGTNNKMLRYKRIQEYFFMDTFFATKKAGKSSRGHACCQLFVTNKGFVYVVPMKMKGEVLQAVQQFAKEVGAPDAIICDLASEQKSEAVRKLCNERVQPTDP